VLFGNSGGVMEAAVRTVYEVVTGKVRDKWTDPGGGTPTGVGGEGVLPFCVWLWVGGEGVSLPGPRLAGRRACSLV
jgi:hypothetical protein